MDVGGANPVQEEVLVKRVRATGSVKSVLLPSGQEICLRRASMRENRDSSSVRPLFRKKLGELG